MDKIKHNITINDKSELTRSNQGFWHNHKIDEKSMDTNLIFSEWGRNVNAQL